MTFKIGNVRYFGNEVPVDQRFCQQQNVLKEHCRAYNKIIINECVFKSNRISLIRSDNSLAMTSDSEFVLILQFVVCAMNNERFVVCRKINVREDFNYCKYVKTVCGFEDNIHIIQTEKLKKLCVLVKSLSKTYLSTVPYINVFS